MDFYNRLNYSLGNEDWTTEEQALRIKPTDKIICVTASGDRPLNLLTTDCSYVTAVDMNPTQSHLLALKIAALTKLDYEKYISFLGILPSSHRKSIFEEIKGDLNFKAAEYWKNHSEMIAKGVIYQGKTERTLCKLSLFCKLKRLNLGGEVFNFTNIDEQRDYLNKIWNKKLLKRLLAVTLHPKVAKLFINDPGLYSYVDGSISPGSYIFDKIHYYLYNNLASKSLILQLLLLGKILPSAYCPYLTETGQKKITENIHKLSSKTENIVDYLYKNDGHCLDVFSMSDIASYMPEKVFERMLQGIYYAAKPEARFCVREFLSKRNVPKYLEKRLIRNPELEYKLEQEESNFVYRFIVGSVDK